MAHQEVNTTELNPDILSASFKVQTNWHVITGAACSGKTTLIKMLTNQGFQTLQESGRLYINQELAKGRKLDDVFTDGATEYCIFDMQMKFEHKLRANDTVFLDRGLPDSLTFHRLAGLDPNELLLECCYHRYASVFRLDQLPLQLDGARVADNLYTEILDEWLERDYCTLGYRVERVPVIPPQKRLAYILDRLPKQISTMS